eukprot:3774932-Rhodomonas_salina.1
MKENCVDQVPSLLALLSPRSPVSSLACRVDFASNTHWNGMTASVRVGGDATARHSDHSMDSRCWYRKTRKRNARLGADTRAFDLRWQLPVVQPMIGGAEGEEEVLALISMAALR